MKGTLEEYGYSIIAALVGALLVGLLVEGIGGDGFITRTIVSYVNTVIGG